jgi:hypothetical protein
LVEDDPGDVQPSREVFCAANDAIHSNVAVDSVEAMDFLRDIDASYELQVNGYLEKPALADDLDRVISYINDFWLRHLQSPTTAVNRSGLPRQRVDRLLPTG